MAIEIKINDAIDQLVTEMEKTAPKEDVNLTISEGLLYSELLKNRLMMLRLFKKIYQEKGVY